MNFKWLPLNVNDIPSCSGVYGFKQGKNWLYIGKSKNLATRLNKNHVPFQIALQFSQPVDFLYRPDKRPGKLENRLIKRLKPQWNGRTCCESLAESLHGIYCSGWSCKLDWFDIVRPMSRKELLSGKDRPPDYIQQQELKLQAAIDAVRELL